MYVLRIKQVSYFHQGNGIRINGKDFEDDKDLHSYISKEELWACTTCNACTEACPVNLDPLNIIYQMRQFLVMEQSIVQNDWVSMNTNIENNGAPWQFSPEDRLNWVNED